MRLLLVLGVCAISALYPTTARAAETPAFDVAAALAHLETQQLYATPGAVASIAPGAALGDLKVLLTPPRPADAKPGGDQATYDTVSDWASAHHAHVVVVTGVRTDLIDTGTAVPSDIISARDELGKYDVTDQLEFLAKLAKNPSYRDPDGQVTPDDSTPAPAALVKQVGDGVAATGSYVAPGVKDTAGDPQVWAKALHGKRVRVAVLPPARPQQAWPDLLTPLHARYPNDEVIVVRGHYLEATGTTPQLDSAAADYLVGTFEDLLAGQALPAPSIVRLFLHRLSILRDGVAFSRRPVYPPSLRHLLVRAAPTTGIVVAGLLALGSVLSVLLARRRNEAAPPNQTDRLRAEVFASLGALNAALVESSPGAQVARAAERQSEALLLWDQAQAEPDPDVLKAAAAAVDEGLALIGTVRP